MTDAIALPDIPLLQDPETDAVCHLVDWQHCIALDPTVIVTKTGRLLTCLAVQCPDTEVMQREQRALYLAQLHSTYASLNEEWVQDDDWWHDVAPPYPAGQWTNAVDWMVDEIRRHIFEAEPRFISWKVLTLTWQPPKGKRRWFQDLFLTKGVNRQEQRRTEEDVMRFQEGILRYADLLRQCFPRVALMEYHATCTYLHQSVSWERYRVQTDHPCDLDYQLAMTPFRPGQPPQLGDQYVQPISVKTWQNTLHTWLPEALSKVRFPCHYHVRWVPMSREEADAYCRGLEKKWASKYARGMKILKQATDTPTESEVGNRDDRQDAIAAGRSILQTQEELARGEEVLGGLVPVVLCWAPDEALLTERVRVILSLMQSQGLVGMVEQAHASLKFLASRPGNVTLGIRGQPLRGKELVAVAPHSDVWSGVPWNEYLKAPALFVASTDGTPFWFTTHVGELGNIKIQGPSRSGKTALLGLMVRQWPRYPRARQAIFDRDYGLKVATILGGGVHYDLGKAGQNSFQPLRNVDQTDERDWALTWLEGVLKGEGLEPTVVERQQMLRALESLGHLPYAQRTMSNYRILMQVNRLKPGLEPYCQGGQCGFFDGSSDAFSLDARLVCFEVNQLFSKPRAIGPTLSHIEHQLDTHWFTGDPVSIKIDEGKWVLNLQEFVGDIEVWLKARAKKNVSVTLAVQDAYDMVKTDVWQAIKNNMPTTVFLPNREAGSATVRPYYDDEGLGDAEILQIMQGRVHQDYLYRSSLGTRMFQMRLSPVERLLCAAGTLEELEVFDRLIATVPQERLAAEWLRHWGFDDHAAMLDELCEQKEQNHVDPMDAVSRDWSGESGVGLLRNFRHLRTNGARGDARVRD